MNIHTSNHLRGHFARICVLVNLSKQLISSFHLDGEDYYVDYEGLHLLCSCGVYGHRSEICLEKHTPTSNGEKSERINITMEKEIGAPNQNMIVNNQDQWKVVQNQDDRGKRKIRLLKPPTGILQVHILEY